MKDKSKFQIGTGVTSILMIFVVLCLTTFAILSYASADADLDMTERHITFIEAYYDAYSKLNDEVAKIDNIIYKMLENDTTQELTQDVVISKIHTEKSENVDIIFEKSEKSIDALLVTDINEKQQLKMEVTININNNKNVCIVNKCYVYTEGEVEIEEETLPDMWGG